MVARFVVAGFMMVIVVVGFFENRFLHAIPNIKNTFLANFPKHKQIIENIFLFIKYFQHITKRSLTKNHLNSLTIKGLIFFLLTHFKLKRIKRFVNKVKRM